MIYDNCLEIVGQTPLINIKSNDLKDIDLFVKMELLNPMGSIKDRSANYIIEKLLKNNEINSETKIIESSSGNFGVSLSAYCRARGLEFYCVVDANISPINEMLIKSLSTSIIKVEETDENGGYLLNRIKAVHAFLIENPNSYWINQYANPYNSEAYYSTLGTEICEAGLDIDYIFIGVSSAGTITGISQKIKEQYPNAKVVAVDIVGSVIFGGDPQKRYIPGIGSSMVPHNLTRALIDEVIMIDEETVVKSCRELLVEHYIFAGGSSGAVYAAIKQYFKGENIIKKPTVLTIFPDRGDRYGHNIYNDAWCEKIWDLEINHDLLKL